MSERKEKAIALSDKCAEYFLYALLFSIPIYKAGTEIFFGLACAAFLVKKSLRPDFKHLKNLLHFFLFLFYLFCALSILNSAGYFAKSFIALFFKWGKYILVFLMAEEILCDTKRLRNCTMVILVAGLIVGIDAFSQRFLGFEFIRGQSLALTNDGFYAVTAAFNHYNGLGVYLVVVLSVSLALLTASDPKGIYVWILSALTVLLVACLLMTFSRGSWLAIIVSFLLMMLISRKYKMVIYLAGIPALLIIFLPQVRQRLLYTFSIGGDADRFVVWQATLAMIKEHPVLGRGIGLFMDHFSKYRAELLPQYAHNCFLQIWAETGILALLSFLVFIWLALYQAIKRLKNKIDPLLLGLVCGVSGFLAHSFFDTDLYSLQLAVLFWFVLGLSVASTRVLECASRQ